MIINDLLIIIRFNSFPTFPKQTADAGFVADWSADFGSLSANEDASSGAKAPASGPECSHSGPQGGAQGWPQDGRQTDGDRATLLQDSKAATAAEDEVSSWDGQTNANLHSSAVRGDEDDTGQVDSREVPAWQEDRRKSTPGLVFTNEYGEQIEDSTEDRRDKWSRSPDGSGSDYETAEEWGDGGQGGGWASADDELSYEDHSIVNNSEGRGSRYDRAEKVLPDCSAEEELPGKQADLTFLYREHSEHAGAEDKGVFETQTGGAADSDVFAETQTGGAADSDLFAQTQGGGAFDSDPFAETQFGEKGGGFELDACRIAATWDGESSWDIASFASRVPAAFSETEVPASSTASCQEVSHSSGFKSSVTQQNSGSVSATEGNKDVNIPRIHKEPENSDMSEDEAANRRLGKLYQELETEKEEVFNFLPSSVW